jgi:hypothetical protein
MLVVSGSRMCLITFYLNYLILFYSILIEVKNSSSTSLK